MVKQCQECGYPHVTNDSLFCVKCGARILTSHIDTPHQNLKEISVSIERINDNRESDNNEKQKNTESPIVQSLIEKYVSGTSDLFTVTSLYAIANDPDFIESLYNCDDNTRIETIRPIQELLDESKSDLRKCRSLEEREDLEAECVHFSDIIEFYTDLGKIQKILAKKGVSNNSKEIVSIFYREFEKKYIGWYERVSGKKISQLKEYYSDKDSPDLIVKKIISASRDNGNPGISHFFLNINYILRELGYNCKFEEVKGWISDCKNELDLDEFEKNLGNPKKQIDNSKLEDLTNLDGYQFEIFLKDLFEKMGYNVIVTPASKDQGADLIVSNNHEKIAVQAKKYSGPVSNGAIQEVVAAMKYYGANKAMVVTTSVFTQSAIDLAYKNEVILWDGDQLDKMIAEVIGL